MQTEQSHHLCVMFFNFCELSDNLPAKTNQEGQYREEKSNDAEENIVSNMSVKRILHCQ